MKTPEQIKLYLTDFMHAMCRVPKMYASTPLGLEIQFLNLIDVRSFIDGNEDTIFVHTEWRKFAKKTIKYSGPFPVSTYLQEHEQLDENWKMLTNLLQAFCHHMFPIPVPA